MSKLSSEEVLSLGSLLCELAPSQMSLLAPEILNSTLQALASCKQIPPRHWRALFQLLNDTYGYEQAHPPIFLDRTATAKITCDKYTIIIVSLL